MRYNNYHKHSMMSNPRTLDCIVKPQEYMDRAVELGHTTYFTTEHGWGGDVWKAYTMCKEKGLKCIFGVEAYYVDNRFEKDRSNYHIILIAKNKEGFEDINRIISEANETGYYYKPRIDKELLLSLNPLNVFVTTACIAGRLFKTENYEQEFLIPVMEHFKDNFFLEVQSHNCPSQIDYNKKILVLSYKYNLKIIHANDSHYIHEKDVEYRDLFLIGKDIKYSDEDGFVLDYPDSDTIKKRYVTQGVLTPIEIDMALQNTLVFDECEDLQFDDEIKIPILDSSKDSKKVLEEIINEEWLDKRKDISKEKWKECIEALKYEIDVIHETGMDDYFIDDYKIADRAVNEYGAILTPTGRGSAVSYITNYVLGFTQVNRVVNDAIPLYPSRFMSKARILQTRSLPDIDLNMAAQEPFIRASKDILGEDNVYPMVSYKPMQESSAFRLWCKAKGYKYSEYNEVAKSLDEYKNDKKWGKVIEESKVFVGVIESISPSPCSFLLYDKPISKEIGLIKVGDAMCCCIDKHSADKYKFLKNDYLVVQVLNIIAGTCKLAGIPIPTINELEKLVDDKTWKIYSEGLTATVNQCDSEFATPLVKRFKPRSVADMAKFVAAIRPGFNFLEQFLSREPYSTGVPQIDELLENSDHYILFQENIMQFLIYCGIEEDLTYGIIKDISKKKMTSEDFDRLKEKIKQGYITKIGSLEGFDTVWEAMESASEYSFNSSHALSYAYDSIYCAYLKSHYPLEYYTTVLNMYNGDIEKTDKIIKELPYFNIKLGDIKFRYSKGEYFYDKETMTIYKGVGSIKYINNKIGDTLYELKDIKFNSFTDLLVYLSENTSVGTRPIEILIKLNYFNEFGNNGKLLKIFNEFQTGKNRYDKKHSNKTKILRISALRELEKNTDDYNIPIKDQIEAELDLLGYINTIYNLPKVYAYIMECNTTYSPKLECYCLANGKTATMKVEKRTYNKNKIKKGDIIRIIRSHPAPRKKKDGDDWVVIEGQTDWWIDSYEIVNF